MRSFWSLSLQRQLAIAIALLVVPVLISAVWSGRTTLRQRTAELGDQTRLVAFATATAVNRGVANVDGMMAVVQSNTDVQALNPTICTDLLRSLVADRPALAHIEVVRRSGEGVARATASSSSDIADHFLGWSDEVFRTDKRFISAPRATPRGLHYVVFGYPIRDASQQTVGAIGFFVNLSVFQDLLVGLPMPDGSVLTISDEGRRIVARSLDAPRFVGSVLPEEPRITSEPVEIVGVDGLRRICSSATVGNGAWVVSASIPLSLALNGAASIWMRNFAILALCLSGWVAIAFVLSRRLATSLGHLEVAAQRIASGDFRPIERRPMPTREFAKLQDTFDTMLERFNKTRTDIDAQMVEERRIREELQSLQRQVIRQERLAAVGQLVSGVAHEINNPLQAILGFAELLQMQRDVPDSVKADLKLIQKESARACNIIRNLSMFARQQVGEAAPVRLTDVIASVAELRQRRLESEDIELRIEDGSRQCVSAVLTELQQVLLNFVVNAEQSILMSGRLPGRITIRSRDEKGHVVLEVEDTGPGLSPDHEAKLFQPFFTTKPVGQGTGLGLSISYGIIDSLGGGIGYRNAPAGGAIFYFDLPAVLAEPA